MKKFRLILLCFTISVMPYLASKACTNFIISKGATVDGSTMICYNADSHPVW